MKVGMFNDAESDLEFMSWEPEEQHRRFHWVATSRFCAWKWTWLLPLQCWGSVVLQWEGSIFVSQSHRCTLCSVHPCLNPGECYCSPSRIHPRVWGPSQPGLWQRVQVAFLCPVYRNFLLSGNFHLGVPVGAGKARGELWKRGWNLQLSPSVKVISNHELCPNIGLNTGLKDQVSIPQIKEQARRSL